jgi:hypothetical protein
LPGAPILAVPHYGCRPRDLCGMRSGHLRPVLPEIAEGVKHQNIESFSDARVSK